MAKNVFTQEQQLDLTKRLQLLLLDSLAAGTHWDIDSTRFQGGTCLSLSYGSSRFSEDLDFVLGTDKGLNRMLTAAQARMSNSLRVSLPGAVVKFAARDEDLEAIEAKNPRTFTMTVSHPDWYRVIKVKAEFWVADPEAVRQYESGVIPAKLLTQAVEGVPLRMTLPPVMLPTATLNEILVDKLHALACRPYLKHRDIFDLWWLTEQGIKGWDSELLARYPYHARMYSDSPELEQLVEVLRAKTIDVQALVGKPAFREDLQKWLGQDSPLSSQSSADVMATVVVAQLERLTAALRLELATKAGDDEQQKDQPGAKARRMRPR
jgi:predicted nucleotidyltransferase component of viral defense system